MTKKRSAPHGKKTLESIGRIALNTPGDWVHGVFTNSYTVKSRDGKDQQVFGFIGTVSVGEEERFGEFELWGNMNLSKFLTEERYGMTLVIECLRREKNKAGDREFSIYRWSEALEEINMDDFYKGK